jgi:hypothetical protein
MSAALVALGHLGYNAPLPSHPPAGYPRLRISRTQCAEGAADALQLNEERNVPIGFRPLSRQEIVDTFNAVPAFSVVNAAEEMVATPDATGALGCTFYLELSEAQTALAELRGANPRTALDLSVAPLGTAFALCEWSGLPQTTKDMFEDDGDDDDLTFASEGAGGLFEQGASSAEGQASLRLKASAVEVEAVGSLLDETPAPPLLCKRNRRLGGLPLFGSDELRFQLPKSADDGTADVSIVRPLFLRRSDFRDAWLASGGPADGLPAAQVADLRTLAWQMQFDNSQALDPQPLHSQFTPLLRPISARPIARGASVPRACLWCHRIGVTYCWSHQNRRSPTSETGRCASTQDARARCRGAWCAVCAGGDSPSAPPECQAELPAQGAEAVEEAEEEPPALQLSKADVAALIFGSS